MANTKKITFIFLICLLSMLAVFSCGISALSMQKVNANDTVSYASDDVLVPNVEKNINIIAFYEELNAGQGGTYTKGGKGGQLGNTTTTCDSDDISVDTNSQSVFYAKASVGYYLQGVYPNDDLSGDSLDITQNDDYYSITYNGEVGSKFYAKFALKQITIAFENGADFTLSGDGTYLYGSIVQLTCKENSINNKFSRWVKVVGEEIYDFSQTASYRFEAKENIRLRAVPKLFINTKQSQNGAIEIWQNSSKTNERYFEKGTELTIKAKPNLGYTFVDYDIGDFAGNTQEFNYIVENPISFGAIFESKKVTISITTNNIEANLGGSTEVDGKQFVIGDEIKLVVSTTKLFGLDAWQTNASGEFDTQSVSQTYIITPQDAEQGSLTFLAKIKKILASCEVTAFGKGFLFVNDTSTQNTLIEDKELNSTFLVTAQEGGTYYLGSVTYIRVATGEKEDWLNKLVDKKLTFTVTEDFRLIFNFLPLTWEQVRVEPKGLGTQESPYLIGSSEELAYMSYGINHDVKGKTENHIDYRNACFKLTDNIDLTGRYWFLIGENNNAKFSGTLDLNYKFITNITLTNDSYSSNLKYLFTSDNFQSASIIHDADKMWRILGISSSAFFAVALIMVLVAFLTNNKTQVKKVVVLKDKDKDSSKK